MYDGERELYASLVENLIKTSAEMKKLETHLKNITIGITILFITIVTIAIWLVIR